MNKFDYKNLTPFKWFVLENFPFIEADFDALTEWQLFCKLGKEINKIIDSQNVVGTQMENVTNAFNNLKKYVDNYFDNLDVQDEINNKLNEMAQDGSLYEIIRTYTDPIVEAQNTEINNFKLSTNATLDRFDTRLNAVASGSPLVASSTSSMTDTTRTYVNTTDGKWYYYNGTSWVAGGTYQSTGIADNSITKAKLNSDLLKTLQPVNTYLQENTDLNTIIENGTYILLNGSYTNCFTDSWIKASIMIVERAFTGTSPSSSNSNIIVQTIINREKPYEIHKRIIYGLLDNLIFSEWIEVATDNDYYQISSGSNLNDYTKEGKGYLLAGTFTNAPKSTMPASIFKVEKVSTLKGSVFEDNAICILQTIIPRDGSAYYIRTVYWLYDSYDNKTYGSWINIMDKSQKENLNILTMGDSIMGMPNQYITDTIANYTTGSVYNCNFGGTTAVDRIGSDFQPFSFVNLVDAKLNNDYTEQDSALSLQSIPEYFNTSLTRFKNLDLSTIDICLVMYGTNDFNSNYPIGNVSDNNKTSILGSLRYGIEKLSKEYPNIRFIILNPIFRVFNSDPTQNSKTYTNRNNAKLIDVDVAEINLANDMLIPSIDMIKLGINENNYSYWLADGVHIKNSVKDEVGSIIANNMLNI